MNLHEVLHRLNELASPAHFQQLAKFGINNSKALGIRVPHLRSLAKEIGKNHPLALELWATEIHEARLLASIIESPENLNEQQFDAWVHDFDSWDLCDVTCDLLGRTELVFAKIEEYSCREEEFVKRSAFSLMCELAFYSKDKDNLIFNRFFEIIIREAWDDRNFVRKAVNWALRQIGKRNETLRLKALETAEQIAQQPTKSARWISKDAIRELTDGKVVERVRKKSSK